MSRASGILPVVPDHHVYLVPGFFGFANLGDLPYFAHVSEYLEEAFAERGVPVALHHVHTHPTASLRYRASRLLDTIVTTAVGDGPIHLVGHSSGGLDARLLVTSGVSLASDHDVEALMARVQSVVTVATPHHGTPVASFFTGLLGQRLLQLLSLFTTYVIVFGRVPVGLLSRMGRLFLRVDQLIGRDRSVVDQLVEQLLGDFTPERRDALRAFLDEVGKDQALMAQLMPDAMDTFNAATADREGVRYASVVTRAPKPNLKSRLQMGVDPYMQVTRGVYGALHRLSTRMPAIRIGELSAPHREALARRYLDVPDWHASDGIVPTLSQPWGTVLDAVTADHHDVIGHFHGPKHVPPHFDWLASGSGFGRQEFERMWSKIVDHLLAG